MNLREFNFKGEKVFVNADLVKYCLGSAFDSSITFIYFDEADRIQVDSSLDDTYYTLTGYSR